MLNVIEDFPTRNWYLLNAYICQTLSRIQGFNGEHLPSSHRGCDGKAPTFSTQQQNRGQWEHVQWAGGKEKHVHSARGEGGTWYYKLFPLYCVSCNFFLLCHMHILPQLWVILVFLFQCFLHLPLMWLDYFFPEPPFHLQWPVFLTLWNV